jgi:hypothetical protein
MSDVSVGKARLVNDAGTAKCHFLAWIAIAYHQESNMSRFRSFALAFIYIGLVACVSEQPSSSLPHGIDPRATQSPVIQQYTGEDVARHLEDRYSKTAADCGTPSQPSFLCNGVMIRGTSSEPTYHVWENSPASIQKGGVSIFYLRSDVNYNKLAYGITTAIS